MAKEFYARFDPATEGRILEEGNTYGVTYAGVIRRLVERGIAGEQRDKDVRDVIAKIIGRHP